MDTVASLPIIQKYDLLHSPEGDAHYDQHEQPLDVLALDINQKMRDKCQQQPDQSIKKPYGKTLGAQLDAGALDKENQFVGIVPVGHKHRHLPNNIVHSAGDAEEIDKNC